MKKALTLFIVAALFSSLCTGCSLQDAMRLMERDQQESSDSGKQQDISDSGEQQESEEQNSTEAASGSLSGRGGEEEAGTETEDESVKEAKEEAGTETEEDAASGDEVSEEVAELPASETADWYAYQTLSSDGQRVYTQVLAAVQNRRRVRVSTLDPDLLDLVYTCVMADHPELFWVNGYRYTTSRIGDEVVSLSFEGTWTFTEDEQTAAGTQLDAALETFLADLPEGEDDYGRLKYCFDRIVRETEYDINAENSQNIVSVFLNHRSVCNGYAKALQLVCRQLDIPCTFVSGTVNSSTARIGQAEDGSPDGSGGSGGEESTSSYGSSDSVTVENHAWDLVQLDGEYYYVDVTWGDPQFDDTVEEDIRTDLSSWINYDYFCVTTEDLVKTHTLSRDIPMPECTATADNYYVRAGTYLTQYEPEKISLAIRQGQADGTGIASMRFATDELFDYAVNRLMNDRVIYEYLPGVTSLRYTSSQVMRTLTVFL